MDALETLSEEVAKRCLPAYNLTRHGQNNLTIWNAGFVVGDVCFHEGFAIVRRGKGGWKTVCSADYGDTNFLEKIVGFIRQM